MSIQLVTLKITLKNSHQELPRTFTFTIFVARQRMFHLMQNLFFLTLKKNNRLKKKIKETTDYIIDQTYVKKKLTLLSTKLILRI